MPVIEADLLLAYLTSKDGHHAGAAKYFSRIMSGELTKPVLTPFALQELELGVRTEKILPHGKAVKNEEEVAAFMTEICEALDFYGIAIQPIECGIFIRAAEIRKKYGLAYYDSHHASAALFYDKAIVSTDRQYDRVKDLKRIDPSKLHGASEDTLPSETIPESEMEEEEDKFEEAIKNKPDLPKRLGKARKDDANEEVG